LADVQPLSSSERDPRPGHARLHLHRVRPTDRTPLQHDRHRTMAAGVFVRAGRTDLDLGQWGLIPGSVNPADPPGKPVVQSAGTMPDRDRPAPTFKGPWSNGQRCIIPAEDFDEPYWGTGRNIWWRFSRADGKPWALAGLW
jgi:putative SOS response-associated peptidase YedK